MKKTIITNTEYETLKLGKTIGKLLSARDIICINGDLGSGKTVLAKGIISGLGIEEVVTSPTFTIINEYNSSKFPVYHLDVYRVSSISELMDIGFDEYICSNGVIIIEWAELIKNYLPSEYIEIKVSKDLGESLEKRIIEIIFHGMKYSALGKEYF